MRIISSVASLNGGLSQFTTSLPFLYQTRTLRGLGALRRSPSNASETVTLIAKCLPFPKNIRSSHDLKCKGIRRQYSSTSGRTSSDGEYRDASNPPFRKHWTSVEFPRQESRLSDRNEYSQPNSRRGRATANSSDTPAEDDIPWNNDPREGQNESKAITTEPASLFTADEQDSDSDPWTSSGFRSENETSVGEVEDSEYYSRVRPRSVASTITIAERRAFDRIFEELLRSRQSSNYRYPGDPEITAVATDSGVETAQSSAKAKLGSIMQSALRIKSARDAESLLAGQTAMETEDHARQVVDRYPPALRAQAAEAMGFVSKPSTPVTDSYDDSDVVQGIRQRERARVESLMRAASTDAKLWEVMEEEVFSIVKRIGFEQKQELSEPSKKVRRSQKKKEIVTTEPFTEKRPEAGSDVVARSENDSAALTASKPSDLTIYGPLYPEYLLLGFRLLHRSFSKPSQLIHNILPRVKSLGVISQVLGASTALYNELLRVAWFQLDDFQGAITMLSEMEAAGLDLDTETLEIVNDIIAMQGRVRKGLKGPALQVLWQMPEFAPGKFNVWRDKIQKGIAARESEYASASWNDLASEDRKQIEY